MVILPGDPDAASFNDDRSPDTRQTLGQKIPVNVQVVPGNSLDWYYRILQSCTSITGELKSAVPKRQDLRTMRTRDEQMLYEERRARAIHELGRRGGMRTLVHRMQQGVLESHMAYMTVKSKWARKARKRQGESLRPFVITRDWLCMRCQHRWKSRKQAAPDRCPSCFARAWNRARKKSGRTSISV